MLSLFVFHAPLGELLRIEKVLDDVKGEPPEEAVKEMLRGQADGGRMIGPGARQARVGQAPEMLTTGQPSDLARSRSASLTTNPMTPSHPNQPGPQRGYAWIPRS